MNLVLKGIWSNNPVPMETDVQTPVFNVRIPLATVHLGSEVTKAYVDSQDALLQAGIDTKANGASVIQALGTKADLINGVIPASQLPSFVDDVLEGTYVDPLTFNNLQGVPYTPEGGKIYVDVNLNTNYRWSGMLYVTTGGGGVSLGETAATAYRGDRGKIAYDHSQSQGNPHNLTTTDVPEGLKLFFTEARVRNSVLSGLVTNNSSNVTNTDTVETAIGKLAARSQAAGGTINWVTVSTLTGYSKHTALSNTASNIQLAVIDGFIWMRGYFSVTNSINAGNVLFSFTDSRFLWDNTLLGANVDNQFIYDRYIHKNIKVQEPLTEYRVSARQIGTGTTGNITNRLQFAMETAISSAVNQIIIEPVCIGLAKSP